MTFAYLRRLLQNVHPIKHFLPRLRQFRRGSTVSVAFDIIVEPFYFGLLTAIFVFVLFFILTMIIVASILVYQLMNHKAAVSLNGQIDATNNIRSMAFELESVSSLFSDPIQKQALLSLVDFIKACPSLSNDSVKEYEDEAADLIHQIVSKIKAGEQADYTAMIENVKVALKNRNNKLKMMG